MGHDQLFKRFFHELLQDFLELFYPDVAARLDFTTLEYLDPGQTGAGFLRSDVPVPLAKVSFPLKQNSTPGGGADVLARRQ